ncbi:hypothetical protein SAMD00023353_10300180 [Rosellinia necatrix]|uniref:Uncharacterized protein n=1 Tax=Rosellinia necatrix TaxID=77044 RepID=A0A1S8AB30_ROSNE|nr:hypothetical protein SAMD00023353_10300180 [Rosellinia necatrix]
MSIAADDDSSMKHLQLFDFGFACRFFKHEDANMMLEKSCFDLATCLHFILSGVDPLSGSLSTAELQQTRGGGATTVISRFVGGTSLGRR